MKTKWLNVVIGVIGSVGAFFGQVPLNWGSALVGLAFLIIIVSGFVDY